MSFYLKKKNVEEYIQMAEGFDGQKLIIELIKYLHPGSSVLEIGMGPGKDMILLEKHYKVTGSDYSEIFINRYKKAHPKADLLVLDALTLDAGRKFQGLYSNKVLIHLTRNKLKLSIKKQAGILESEGIICHSFWYGDKEENYDGLIFVYYTAKQLQKLFMDAFDIIKIEKYQEIEPDDSIFIIAERCSKLFSSQE